MDRVLTEEAILDTIEIMSILKKFKESYLWALASTSLLFLVFFRGRWALRPGIYDDQCYLEWLYKFIAVPYPRCYSASHLPGVAIQWIPAGLLSRGLSHLTGIPLNDWLEPLVGLQTFLTWGICLVLLQKIFLKLNLSVSQSKKIALIFLLNLPVLEFMTQFNFTTVGAEILLSSLLVYSILSRSWIVALATCSLLNLTRINDPVAFLLIGGALIELNKRNELTLSSKTKALLLSLFIILVSLAAGFTLYVGLVTGYNGVFLTDLLPRLYPYRWWRGLFMGSWGLFWTAPAGILCFLLCSFYLRKLSWLARAGLLWVLSEVTIIVVLNELRSDYVNPPWRYLIGSLIGLIPAIVETNRFLSNDVRKWGYRAVKFLALWQVYLAFVTHSFTILNYWKVARWADDWSLLHYVYLLKDPSDLIKLLYVAPLGFSLFSWGKNWAYFQRYENYLKYAINGPSLYLLTLGLAFSILFLTWYLWNKFPRKNHEVL